MEIKNNSPEDSFVTPKDNQWINSNVIFRILNRLNSLSLARTQSVYRHYTKATKAGSTTTSTDI